jgi:hypothetical protein
MQCQAELVEALYCYFFSQPDLSGALFVSFGKSLGTKKRERRAEIAAQIINSY